MGAKNTAGMVKKFYLPDTNILIYALADQKPYSLWLRAWIENRILAFSSIVVAEFLSGASSEEALIFRGLLEKFKVLPVDSLVAQQAAIYRKNFMQKKKKVWLSDCLIAATCKLYNTTLITYDKRDFPMTDIAVLEKP